jgi:phytanoyl-CoA hydroxylase
MLRPRDAHGRTQHSCSPHARAAALVLRPHPTRRALRFGPRRLGSCGAPQDGYYWCLAEEREAGKLGGLTMWLALDAADESNGCMWYVCGSVSDGLRPHAFSGVKGFSQTLADYGPADERREAAMCAQPGDLLMHSALLVHRAGANRSERPRRAIGAIFYAESARVDHARHEARAKEIAARSAHLAGQK